MGNIRQYDSIVDANLFLLERMSKRIVCLCDTCTANFCPISLIYLFAVSSLHRRCRFSFDPHDPGVFSAPTVSDLLAHYKDPSHCMFFEPMLTKPLHRNNPFSLQQIARGAICSQLTYDGVSQLELPIRLKEYLREYHYKQQVQVRRYDY